MTNILEEKWIIYRDACYPDGCPKTQEVETRQAFFAGALTALTLTVESAENLSEKNALIVLQSMCDEAQAVCLQRKAELEGRN